MTQFYSWLKFDVISEIDFSWLEIVHILEKFISKYIYLYKGFGFKPQFQDLFIPCQLKILTKGECVHRQYLIRFYRIRQVVYTPQCPYVNTSEWPQKNFLFKVSAKKKKKKNEFYRSPPSLRQRRSKDKSMLIT